MKKPKSKLEVAAGKLISAIQKEWGAETGELVADQSEEVISKGHSLLCGSKNGNVEAVLDGRSVTQFLGDLWVHRHPNVKRSIDDFEVALHDSSNV